MVARVSDFCRQHAFYDCPICRGEEPVWVIPIVDGADPMGHGGNVVGVLEVPATFMDSVGYYDVPWEGPGAETPPIPVDAGSPDLLETVKSIFSITSRPEYQEAAARGRKVHEDALTLMDEDPTISYQEAIEEILQGREDD